MNIPDQNLSDQFSDQQQPKCTWVAPEFIEDFVENTTGGPWQTGPENGWYHS